MIKKCLARLFASNTGNGNRKTNNTVLYIASSVIVTNIGTRADKVFRSRFNNLLSKYLATRYNAVSSNNHSDNQAFVETIRGENNQAVRKASKLDKE